MNWKDDLKKDIEKQTDEFDWSPLFDDSCFPYLARDRFLVSFIDGNSYARGKRKKSKTGVTVHVYSTGRPGSRQNVLSTIGHRVRFLSNRKGWFETLTNVCDLSQDEKMYVKILYSNWLEENQNVEEGEYDHLLKADGFDAAIIGVSEKIGQSPCIAYDRDKCVEILIDTEHMSYEEAEEYFEYNVAGAYVGEFTPCFVTTRGGMVKELMEL
jgi:hypothetical protein